MNTFSVRAFGNTAAKNPLAPLNINRRKAGPTDVEIEILYCGVCHSDIHQARSEWPGTVYPCVPGHEIVGRVTRVGPHVKKFKIGGELDFDINEADFNYCHWLLLLHTFQCLP